MNQPATVRYAVISIWLTIALAAIAAVISKIMGEYTESDFVGALVIYGIFCIFPYKINKGSNPSRYIYSILCVMTVLLLIGGMKLPKADYVVSLLSLPLEVFAVFNLFRSDSSHWFTAKQAS